LQEHFAAVAKQLSWVILRLPGQRVDRFFIKQHPQIQSEDLVRTQRAAQANHQIDDLLEQAKRAIADGEVSLRKAAECIAEAQSQGATQRQIAETVSKSAAWVNQLLKWRSDGFNGSAFGTVKARQRAAFRPSEQRAKPKPVTTDEQARVEQARAEAAAEKARERAAKAEAERAKH
jgi:hypothetical protein